MFDKLLSFTLSGKRAGFFATDATASRVTYPFMTFSAVRGILGAVIGLERHQVQEFFSPNQCAIGIEVLHYGDDLSYGTNYYFGSEQHIKRKPTSITEKQHVQYRLHVSHRKQLIMEELYSYLSRYNSVYPLTLGSAYCLARVSDVMYKEQAEFQQSAVGAATRCVLPDKAPIQVEGHSNIIRLPFFIQTAPFHCEFVDIRYGGADSFIFTCLKPLRNCLVLQDAEQAVILLHS